MHRLVFFFKNKITEKSGEEMSRLADRVKIGLEMDRAGPGYIPIQVWSKKKKNDFRLGLVLIHF